MKNKMINYEEAPREIQEALESSVKVDDFLPPPSQLVKKRKKENITISMKPSTVAFFKKEAALNNTQYQTMINALLDYYVEHYEELNKRNAVVQ